MRAVWARASFAGLAFALCGVAQAQDVSAQDVQTQSVCAFVVKKANAAHRNIPADVLAPDYISPFMGDRTLSEEQ